MATESPDDPGSGQVVALSRRRCDVRLGETTVRCVLAGALAERARSAITVGDMVRVEASGDDHVVAEVLPRRTVLSRPDPRNPHLERVIVANVDVVVIVVSLRSPPLRPRLIDRYLVAASRGGAETIIVVNKIDLLDGPPDLDEEAGPLADYAALVSVRFVSTEDGRGVADLRAALAGRTCALVGHSGVGKSSLANALAGELDLETGGLRRGDGKGRHTTTQATMHEIGHGIRLVDTPGIRSFGLGRIGVEELQWYFPEFDEYADHCRFRDCTHDHEPACAVREAAEEGGIPPARYETYKRLLKDQTR